MPNSVTQLRFAGPVGAKRNLVVLGDGFAVADQNLYDSWVQNNVLDGVFAHDYFYEDASAWNIFRVNLISQDSGVGTKVYNPDGSVTTNNKNTALGIFFNGSWDHCWLEYGPNSDNLIKQALNKWVPSYTNVLIVLNHPGFGGCGGGNRAHVTRGVGWDVIAQEFGHGIGGLCDEYCHSGCYNGSEPGCVNVTINTNRATLKWRNFVAPSTPIPTGKGNCVNYNQGPRPANWDSNQDVGLFEGALYCNTCIYRPVENCRMVSNSPPFCPVCYTSIKKQYDSWTGHKFLKCYAGDFNGDGKSDVLVHFDNSVQIFRSNGKQLDLVFSVVSGDWQFAPNDQFYIGDFDGDGKDEVVVFNSKDWNMPYLGLLDDDGKNGLKMIARYDGDIPGWGGFAANDLFYVGDFDGDGKKDLYVFNGSNYSTTYVGMLRSKGNGFNLIARYDGDIPGWGGLRSDDRLYVGDFNGDKKADLYIFNGINWSRPYLGMIRSNGSSLQTIARYDGDIPGWGGLRKDDQFYIGDFNGDVKADLYIFNGLNWARPYLGMFKSDGNGLQMVVRYDTVVPGWGDMKLNDVFYPADVNGDGKTDLIVYNWKDWGTEYLGKLISNGSALNGSYVGNWIGEWNLGSVDQFEVCNFEGLMGKPDLFVHNLNWFGMISAHPGFKLQKIYYRWIHNYRYGRNW